MDIEPGWEKKALMMLAVIIIIIVVYAYGPFEGEAKTEVIDNISETPAPAPAPTVTPPNNQTPANITNVTTYGNNATYQITADQAKKIASQHNFTTGKPTKGNLTINNNSTVVWIVPLMNGTLISKRIHVDAATGVIVGSEKVKINQNRKRSWELSQ